MIFLFKTHISIYAQTSLSLFWDSCTEYSIFLNQNLSGSPSDIAPETCDDTAHKKAPSKPASLHRVSSDSGKLEVKEVATAPFNPNALDSGDCFILDSPATRKIFVWKGENRF